MLKTVIIVYMFCIVGTLFLAQKYDKNFGCWLVFALSIPFLPFIILFVLTRSDSNARAINSQEDKISPMRTAMGSQPQVNQTQQVNRSPQMNQTQQVNQSPQVNQMQQVGEKQQVYQTQQKTAPASEPPQLTDDIKSVFNREPSEIQEHFDAFFEQGFKKSDPDLEAYWKSQILAIQAKYECGNASAEDVMSMIMQGYTAGSKYATTMLGKANLYGELGEDQNLPLAENLLALAKDYNLDAMAYYGEVIFRDPLRLHESLDHLCKSAVLGNLAAIHILTGLLKDDQTGFILKQMRIRMDEYFEEVREINFGEMRIPQCIFVYFGYSIGLLGETDPDKARLYFDRSQALMNQKLRNARGEK